MLTVLGKQGSHSNSLKAIKLLNEKQAYIIDKHLEGV
jgi:hypothetical protein